MNNVKILIVEDSMTQAIQLKYILEEEGFNVSMADNGVKAMEYLDINKKDLPDIVISDIMMPEMDGLELTKLIKKVYQDIFVIIFTATNDEDSLKNSFESGATDYIPKPIQKTELLVRVKNVVRIKCAEQMLKKALESITESNKKLEEISITDELTGTYNRRYILKQLEIKICELKKHSAPLSLMIIDLDKFKSINDTYGHAGGDEALVKFSSYFKQNIHESDIIGRYGGDEFLIIFPNTTAEKALVFINSLLPGLKKLTFDSMPKLKMTCSGGLCEFSSDMSLEDLISEADRLLYKAKKSGRNKIEY